MRWKWVLVGVVVLGTLAVIGRHSIKPRLHTAVDLVLSRSWGEFGEPRAVVNDSLIAHACGGVGGKAYTNSLTALDSNYAKGHRVFEMDMERTTDGKVVLLHDWDPAWQRLHPNALKPGRRTLADFLSAPMIDGLKPMDWPLLSDWLARHKDAFIVTDVKDDNLAILKILSERRDLVPQIIPQIYSFRQFGPVQEMGYPRILLTLYRLDVENWAVLRFAKTHPVSGIVCWPARGRTGDLVRQLRTLGVPVIAHTINSAQEVAELNADGFTGVMTDFLTP